MIRYALCCEKGHDFESWFRSSADFDEQQQRGLVTCPACGSARVAKQIMAPSLARTDKPESVQPAAPAMQNAQPVALIDDREQHLRAMIRTFREQVLAQSENVGQAFAEEARKIHYGESERRSIYGEASPDAVRELLDEGVECHPLPALPDDRN